MAELVTAEKPKEKILASFKLETLGKGVGNINSNYQLLEVLRFIKDLDVKTSLWTNELETALEIVFPTPTFSRINSLKEFDSTIYITGPLKEKEPKFRAQGERQIWRPTGFVASIELSDEKDNPKAEEVVICTELQKIELEKVIKAAIGETPDKWQFNL